MTEGATRPKPRVSFEEGETVRVIDGPFANFTGVVVELKAEKQKVRVNVSIFGRATPVELDFAQVEKVLSRRRLSKAASRRAAKQED